MNTLSKIIVVTSLAVGMTACLNDDEHFVNFAGSGYVAEIPYVANRSVLRTVSIPASSAGTVVPVDINIASPNPPTQDVPVTVALDQAALTAYNKANDSTFAVLPAAAYQLANPTVTVTSGQRIATVNVNVVGNQIPTTGGPYTLPISITTVPANVVISANYHTLILRIVRTQ